MAGLVAAVSGDDIALAMGSELASSVVGRALSKSWNTLKTEVPKLLQSEADIEQKALDAKIMKDTTPTIGKVESLQYSLNKNITEANKLIEEYNEIEKKGYVSQEERAARYGQKPVTVMFIGLSGSGKTTLAHALERRLFNQGRLGSVLDGKLMRMGISKDLPHDAAGRAENLRRSAYIARYLNESGMICCAAFVASSADAREHAISVIGDANCILVYLNPPLNVCKIRDPSGLYAADLLHASGNVPGISFPFEEPNNANLILPTHELSVEECIDRVLNVLKEKSVL